MSTPFKFCPECNNLLYPIEHKNKILHNACRTCNYTEVAESNLVYRNEITHTSERPQILREAYADPTLPRAKELKCLVWNHPQVAYFLEAAESNRVYRNVITLTSELPQILRDAYADPTLPRAKGLKCPVCNHPHVAYFLFNPMESLAQMNACCNPSCGHNWRADGRSIA